MALVRDAEEASDSEELQKSEAADAAGGNVAGVAAVGTGWPYLTGTRRATTSLGFRGWTYTPKTRTQRLDHPSAALFTEPKRQEPAQGPPKDGPRSQRRRTHRTPSYLTR